MWWRKRLRPSSPASLLLYLMDGQKDRALYCYFCALHSDWQHNRQGSASSGYAVHATLTIRWHQGDDSSWPSRARERHAVEFRVACWIWMLQRSPENQQRSLENQYWRFSGKTIERAAFVSTLRNGLSAQLGWLQRSIRRTFYSISELKIICLGEILEALEFAVLNYGSCMQIQQYLST